MFEMLKLIVQWTTDLAGTACGQPERKLLWYDGLLNARFLAEIQMYNY